MMKSVGLSPSILQSDQQIYMGIPSKDIAFRFATIQHLRFYCSGGYTISQLSLGQEKLE